MELYKTTDGFLWEIKKPCRARELLENNVTLYIVDKQTECEREVYTKEDFDSIDSDEFFAEEHGEQPFFKTLPKPF